MYTTTFDAPTNCSAASRSRNSSNIRIPLIYFVNCSFLMFERVESTMSFSCQHERTLYFLPLGHHISPSSSILSRVSFIVLTACSVVQPESWAPAMLICPPPPSFSMTSWTFTSSIDLALIYSLSS